MEATVEHSTTLDVRDLDCLYLATIGGADYYETRQIVRSAGGVRSVVGLASDWPLIQRDARITELTALLVASEQRSVEADCHVAELLARLSAYEAQIAIAPAADEAVEPMAEMAQLREDGKIPCDHPGCLHWVDPRGLGIHKRKAHGVIGKTGHRASMAADQSPSVDERRKCPYCRLRPLIIDMDAHIARAHPEHLAIVERAAGPIAIALGDAPWRCDHCHESTHAWSLKDPALCIRCVVASADAPLTNGRLAAA
jgi:hypothetical protein